ncbi:MAG: hypothetical protein AAFP87_11935 [Pseudomonadota bacterium]
MPATSRDDLLHITDREWAKLAALLATIPEKDALQKDEDDTSI